MATSRQILAKPGMGVDEGFMIAYNEMQRILAVTGAGVGPLPQAILQGCNTCSSPLHRDLAGMKGRKNIYGICQNP